MNNSVAAQNPSLKITGVKNLVGASGEDAFTEVNKTTYLPKTPEVFTYDADGNLTSDAKWNYTWDAENRLVALQTLSAVATSFPALNQRLEFTYDGQGRRISKKVYSWNSTAWVLGTSTRFLHDGWNLLAELNALNSNAVVGTYVWGSDLSGSSQGAGGVGGLLFSNFSLLSSTSYASAYDGNGNTIGLVDMATGAKSATYDYNAFGETIQSDGVASVANHFRFSTKYTDDETGLLYYGYRFYQPTTGRWPSRDPMEEEGGINLFSFNYNSPINSIDPLGNQTFKASVTHTLFPGVVIRGKIEVGVEDEGCCKRIKLGAEVELGVGVGEGVEVTKFAGAHIGAMLGGLGRRYEDEIVICPDGIQYLKIDRQLINFSKFLSQSLYLGDHKDNPLTYFRAGFKVEYDIEAAISVRAIITRTATELSLRSDGFVKYTMGGGIRIGKYSLGSSNFEEKTENSFHYVFWSGIFRY